MSRRINYVAPADNAYRRNPIRLTVEGTYLSPEHYIMVKSKCEKFVEDLLANFDDVEFGFPEEIFTSIEEEIFTSIEEEIFTSIETERSIRGEE